MTYILFPSQIDPTVQVGGKAGTLAALSQFDLPIPAWFVVTPAALLDSLTPTQRRQLAESGDTPNILSWFDSLTPAPAVQAELASALARLSPEGEPVAVRSSAPAEDGPRHSFAGQLDSFLNVPLSGVAEKVVAVWRSAFGPRLQAYHRQHGLNSRPQPPAVLIQRMVPAEAAGVAFSRDPVAHRPGVAVVSAAQGLGSALVSGAVEGDTFYVDRAGRLVERHLATGTNGNGRSPGPGLTDVQVQAVAELARQVAAYQSQPQDIEWALAAGRLYLLQARPITGATQNSDNVASEENNWGDTPHAPRSVSDRPITTVAEQSSGPRQLWDNSNIAESYPGMTTPLTFSFARTAYEAVYRQFCRLMGVSPALIAAEADTFQRMLGLIRGRIYYNLLSWYRVLALLPGYRLNRRFMEQMMGVKEPLPVELLPEPPSLGNAARWREGLRLGRSMLGLVANYLGLPGQVKAFYDRLNRALGPERPDLSQKRPDELGAYYRELEQQLLTRWDAPLVNDFFAMIFFGLLRQLTKKWAGDTDGRLANALLAGTGGIISAEPARRLQEMARLAAANPALVTSLQQEPVTDILARLVDYPQLEASYRAYLERFGERCLEELKLESPTLHDDPLPLLRAVGQLAAAPPSGREAGRSEANPAGAEAQLRQALVFRPLRRLLLGWLLRQARRLLRQRENLRFERTRLFGRARHIFVELGRCFHQQGLLAHPRDIFYLEVGEVLGLVEGTTVTNDVAGLVALRRAEFDRYRAAPPPPDRFESQGLPGLAVEQTAPAPAESPDEGNSRLGLGCSPGRVRGRVRVVTDPKTARFEPGEILVAERTDPGWIMLFSAAAGLLVEYGSLLSHAAIVSRELGLPAVVSLQGATRWLRDGDWVEFDGGSGRVTKVIPGPTEPGGGCDSNE